MEMAFRFGMETNPSGEAFIGCIMIFSGLSRGTNLSSIQFTRMCVPVFRLHT